WQAVPARPRRHRLRRRLAHRRREWNLPHRPGPPSCGGAVPPAPPGGPLTRRNNPLGGVGKFRQTRGRPGGGVDRVTSTATGARVGRESFGKIPGIGARVYKAYDEHVRACEDGIASAAEAMAAIASGVRAVITNTGNTNEAIKESLKNIEIRGVE